MDFYHRSALILDSLDAKKGSVKGLCMAEAKRGKFGKEGEAARFLKVIVEVLKYRPHLEHLLATSDILTADPKLFVAPVWADPPAPKAGSAASATKALKAKTPKKQRPIPTPIALATVMVHDLLFAKRGLTLPKEHKVRKKLEKYKPAMDKETEKERKRKKVSSNEGLQIPLPDVVASAIEGIGKGKKREMNERGEEDGLGNVRWLRVNTLKWTVEEAVEWFENERWELLDDIEALLSSESKKVFCLDAHIEPLLALPLTVSLPSLLPYTDSRLIAQDKASCMPAWVLLADHLRAEDDEAVLEANSSVVESFEAKELKTERKKKNGIRILDATAAPGNKTTMAAALAGEHGRVVAVERDAGRFKVLKEMCQKAGCKNVTPMNVDFLSIDPQDNKFKNISHFLVDPSCSGSGIPSRLDHLLPEAPEEEQKQRIRALSNFQLTILSHAMRFTGARRVVYSTCSIWGQEDEGVVTRVLAKKEFQEKGWALAPRDEVMPSWERRGVPEECGGDKSASSVPLHFIQSSKLIRTNPSSAIADSVVRALPEDGTNGFFVACFIRTVPEGYSDEPEVTTTEATEADESTTTTISHASRQEAFKAKARAKGGKGGPKGVVVTPNAKKEKVPEVRVLKKSYEKAVKKGVPGKKAAYLAEKAKRSKK
ncbi:25S rRNA (cytosine2278-C5)-methyltransferase, partial [Phenoliferia sp. Uapishka_3]